MNVYDAFFVASQAEQIRRLGNIQGSLDQINASQSEQINNQRRLNEMSNEVDNFHQIFNTRSQEFEINPTLGCYWANRFFIWCQLQNISRGSFSDLSYKDYFTRVQSLAAGLIHRGSSIFSETEMAEIHKLTFLDIGFVNGLKLVNNWRKIVSIMDKNYYFFDHKLTYGFAIGMFVLYFYSTWLMFLCIVGYGLSWHLIGKKIFTTQLKPLAEEFGGTLKLQCSLGKATELLNQVQNRFFKQWNFNPFALSDSELEKMAIALEFDYANLRKKYLLG